MRKDLVKMKMNTSPIPRKIEIPDGPNTSSEYARIVRTSSSGEDVDVSLGTTFSRSKNPKVSLAVRDFLESYENKAQSIQANRVLDVIDNILINFIDIEFPVIDFFVDDDGSLNLQWNIEDSTLGFGFETDPRESFWIMLSGEDDRDVRAQGNLDNHHMILPWLISILEKKAAKSQK